MERRTIQSSVDEEMLLVYVHEIRRRQPRIGTRKLYAMLEETMKLNHIKVGRDKLFELLRRHDLLVKPRRKRVKTTDSNHVFRNYPNLIGEYVPSGPEQIWVSDLTYLSTGQGFVYLSLVTDQYSKMIMGYHVSARLEVNGPLQALSMALNNRVYPESKLIHHSDRGIQYCCGAYISTLKAHGVVISMSGKGNPYENAVAERVNGILKTEFYLDRFFRDRDQATGVVEEVIAVYNTERPHTRCDYLTPQQAHECRGMLKRRWKEYKLNKPKKEPEPIGEEVKKVLEQLFKKEVVHVDKV